MKRIFFSLFFSMFILQGCSTVSDVYDWAFEDEEEVSTEIINQNQTQYEYVTVNIKDKIAVYNLSADQRQNKLGGNKLENYPIQNLPKFLVDNIDKYQEWID